MRILLNGAWRELPAAAATTTATATTAAAVPVTSTLAALLQVYGYGNATVATAVNGEFVPSQARGMLALRDGDRVEVLAPMQGG